MEISRQIFSTGFHAPSLTQVIEFSRNLEKYDAQTFNRITEFLNSGRGSAASISLYKMVNAESSMGGLRLAMDHHELLLRKLGGSNTLENFVNNQLVGAQGLDEWRLSYWGEQKIIEMILVLRAENIAVGGWLTPYIVMNPDKQDRVLDVLRKRTVTSAEAMETILDDGIPTVMQEGAL